VGKVRLGTAGEDTGEAQEGEVLAQPQQS